MCHPNNKSLVMHIGLLPSLLLLHLMKMYDFKIGDQCALRL